MYAQRETGATTQRWKRLNTDNCFCFCTHCPLVSNNDPLCNKQKKWFEWFYKFKAVEHNVPS